MIILYVRIIVNGNEHFQFGCKIIEFISSEKKSQYFHGFILVRYLFESSLVLNRVASVQSVQRFSYFNAMQCKKI